MKLRTEAYIPDLTAKPYRLGTRSVYLRAGDVYGYLPFQKRLERALLAEDAAAIAATMERRREAKDADNNPPPPINPDVASADAGSLAVAATLYSIWDDAQVCWHAQMDIDALLQADGAELLEGCRRLRLDVSGRGAVDLGITFQGIDPSFLIRALAGLGEAPAAPEDAHAGES